MTTEPNDPTHEDVDGRPGPVLGDLRSFLDASPSPSHVVRSCLDRLLPAGFQVVDERAGWNDVPAAGVVVRDGALIAWRLPERDRASAPVALVGAHTDSPGLRVKPRPDTGTAGWKQIAVEVYGGVLSNSWLDRDLGVAGRLLAADGTDVLVTVAEPIARVPQLAIHLDRTVNDGGLVLDKQRHLTPIWGLGDPSPGEFADWIGRYAGLPTAPTWWDLCLYDVQPSSILGAHRDLLASGRLDNQVSCWAALHALIGCAPSDRVAMIVLNDHEEVGSASTTGASGPFLERVLERLVIARGGGRAALLEALSGSTCVSADNAHAVHPNYPERHDPEHRPAVNQGPAIKLNANQRYATSPAAAALFRRACDIAGVPSQVFVSRNDMPCGSTIGPLTATRLGIDTCDVGVPQLSMHSARELCGTEDPVHLATALHAYWSM